MASSFKEIHYNEKQNLSILNQKVGDLTYVREVIGEYMHLLQICLLDEST